MSSLTPPVIPNRREVEACGVCDSTRIHRRETMEPPYRCECGNEFTSPTIRTTRNGELASPRPIEQVLDR